MDVDGESATIRGEILETDIFPSLNLVYDLGGDKNLVGGPGNDGVLGGEDSDKLLGNSGNDLANGAFGSGEAANQRVGLTASQRFASMSVRASTGAPLCSGAM